MKCKGLVLLLATPHSRGRPQGTGQYTTLIPLYRVCRAQYPESTSALVQRVADLQRSAGIVLVDPNAAATGGSTVTVTGW